MKKLVLLVTVLLFGCLLFSFTASNSSSEISTNRTLGYLPANCDTPVHFQIDSQEPCPILKVNENTGALSLKKACCLCGNFDTNDVDRVQVNYSVTNADGVTQSDFIIIDLEEIE